MITIRNTDMQTVERGPAQAVIAARAAVVGVERVDVYTHPQTDAAMLGVAFVDGSSGICDWRDARGCIDWVKSQTWAAGRAFLHFPRQARPEVLA